MNECGGAVNAKHINVRTHTHTRFLFLSFTPTLMQSPLSTELMQLESIQFHSILYIFFLNFYSLYFERNAHV